MRPRALLALATHLTALRLSTERAMSPLPYTSLESYAGDEDLDPSYIVTEEDYHTNRGTTMLPRYLQLGNQTVDLNKLFRVPQEGDDQDGNQGRRKETHSFQEIGPRREEDLSSRAVTVTSEWHSRGSHRGEGREREGGHRGHSGHIGPTGQMPWLKSRPPYEHDRRHGPHFEDASMDNSSITVQAGHTAHLDCRVSLLRDKTVSWVRRRPGQAPLLLTVGAHTYTGDSRYSVQFRYPGNWRLRLAAVNKSDEGLYECQLSTHPPSVIRVHLNVDAPEVSIVDEAGVPLREKYYEAESTLSLRCVVRGADTGSVWWLHGRRELHRDVLRGGVSVRTEARPSGADSTLRLSRLAPADAGNYTCALSPAHAYTVLVHVLNEESLAELQQGSSTCGPPSLLGLFLAFLFASAACS